MYEDFFKEIQKLHEKYPFLRYVKFCKLNVIVVAVETEGYRSNKHWFATMVEVLEFLEKYNWDGE